MDKRVKAGDTIVVWFSCGAASAVAAMKTISTYGNMCNVRVVNNYVKQEHEDNRRFLRDIESLLGIEIEIAVSSMYPAGDCVEVWEDRKYMGGVKGAPCTTFLKKKARQEWESVNHHDWLVLGFTSEEVGRHKRFVLTERDNVLPILIDEGISKQQCIDIIMGAGVAIPEMYNLGYPNANCIGCVKATSPTYWSHVRSVHPEVFQERAEQSRRIGARLVRYKGKRMFLDELPEGASGNRMKSIKMPDCTIFCEE